jgi:hypothetical protein
MQITKLSFRFALHPGEIPKFRAAILGCLGLGHKLFHGFDNSVPGQTKYSNQYPLVNFGVYKGRGQITGMGPGADAIIRFLLPVLPTELYIGDRACATTDYGLKVSNWDAQIMDEPYTFGLYRWMALNKKNYQDWKKLEGNEAARAMLLGRCLTGHLRACAEAADSRLDRQAIEAEILQVDKVKMIRWHGAQLVTFNAIACANFIPPFGLGIGRCHSFGFGEVCGEKAYGHLTRPKRELSKTGLVVG